MRARVPLAPGSRDAVLARLHDPSTWPGWVPGLREVVGELPSIEVQFGGPRPFRCGLEVELPPEGMRFQLEVGELKSFSGRLEVDAAALEIEVDIQFGPTVPGMLWASLETDYLRDLVAGLTAAPPGSGRPGG